MEQAGIDDTIARLTHIEVHNYHIPLGLGLVPVHVQLEHEPWPVLPASTSQRLDEHTYSADPCSADPCWVDPYLVACVAADSCPAARGHRPVAVEAVVADGDVHEGGDNYRVEAASSREVRSSRMEQN